MTNTFKLHNHQDVFIHELRMALREYQSVLGRAPTGMGKTVCASFMTKTAHDKGADVIFMVHRRELLEQTALTFKRAGIPHTFIAAGHHYNPRMRVAIATVGTLVNRTDDIRPPKLFIPDEAHHCAAASWSKCTGWAKAYKSKVVGLTATPWRLSGEGLRQHFDHMVMGPNEDWLMNNINPDTGLTYLSKYRAFAPFIPDLSQVHSQSGDFVTSEIEGIMSDKAVISDCVGQWKSKAYAKRTIGFASSVAHSQLLVDEFNAAGIPAAHVDANTPKEERRHHIQNFAAGHIPILFNCDLFGEGFDLSAIAGRDVPIEAVIQMRPTQSLSLHLQQLGRGLRPKEQPAIFLDMCGNLQRHGFPDSEYEWSLDPRAKRKKASDEDVEKAKQCPACYFVHSPGMKMCPACGHVYEVNSREMEEIEGDLKEITKETMQAPPPKRPRNNLSDTQIENLNMTIPELIKVAKERGKAPDKAAQWAAARYTSNRAKKRAAGVAEQ